MMGESTNLPGIQNLLSNPDFMHNLILNNPLLRQVIDRNPELAHRLSDPNILCQTFESIRNPELMRETMRNTDRAMSNIESSPEEFDMLRHMYENVQEPLLNAITTAWNTENGLGSNPLAALLGTQGRGQTVNQSTNSSNSGSELAGSPTPNADPIPNPWGSSGATEAGGAHPDDRRTNPARQPTPDGLGGLGLPQIGDLFGAMPDSNPLNQLMQNPGVLETMQRFISNPQLMSQQLLALQQSLVSQLGQRQASQEPDQTDGGTGASNAMGLEMLMNILGGFGAGTFNHPRRSDVPPEQLYATQLSQLQEMGFIDTRENIHALIATAGNVHAAVERILGNPGQ